MHHAQGQPTAYGLPARPVQRGQALLGAVHPCRDRACHPWASSSSPLSWCWCPLSATVAHGHDDLLHEPSGDTPGGCSRCPRVRRPAAGCDRPSREAADRIGADRTTMTALVVALEDKGLVARRRNAEDRRRNTVEPTTHGQEDLHRAEEARPEAERRFLAALSDADAERFLGALRTLAGFAEAEREQDGTAAR
ncbi:MarR family winged helix-turn-helix transcriptional regulator [Streptomyces sp. CA-142005]|uniref:MarR family winged helix-turn-helix transcriptional regulator n=1 Tax=Streptomyces sp. CA-142005 TaxID=3240052 RepID=UPI003D914EFD